MLTRSLNDTVLSACDSEQAAAAVLGYSQVTWDNESGMERVPASAAKSWSALSDNEKEAAAVLGYSQVTWDGETVGNYL